MSDRQNIVAAIQKVIGGTPLNRYSRSTIYEPNHCAQLVRETVEGGLGIRANEWEVSQLAHKYRQRAGRQDRFALDYEAAARELGLAKPFSQVVLGDVLYWEYKQWGHTALYAGMIDGEPYVLENSGWEPSQRQRQGARLPLAHLSQQPAYVFLSPLRLLGPPRQVIYPTTSIMRAETGQAEPPPAARVESIGPLPGQSAALPFVRLLNRAGQMEVTPYTKANYWGLIEFERVPGGVVIRPINRGGK